jgi:hypothetical protein
MFIVFVRTQYLYLMDPHINWRILNGTEQLFKMKCLLKYFTTAKIIRLLVSLCSLLNNDNESFSTGCWEYEDFYLTNWIENGVQPKLYHNIIWLIENIRQVLHQSTSIYKGVICFKLSERRIKSIKPVGQEPVMREMGKWNERDGISSPFNIYKSWCPDTSPWGNECLEHTDESPICVKSLGWAMSIS